MAESSRPSFRNDMRTEQILDDGATVNQLAILFKIDKRIVADRLRGKVKPNGNKKKGYELYWVHEAAQHLVPAIFDLDKFARLMRLSDMPVVLTKEYWAGRRSQQLWQRDNNELWHTSQVMDVLTALTKTFRMSVLAVNESISREENLTPEMRVLIRDNLDRVLKEAYDLAKATFQQLKISESEAAIRGAEEDVRGLSDDTGVSREDAIVDDDPNGGI